MEETDYLKIFYFILSVMIIWVLMG